MKSIFAFIVVIIVVVANEAAAAPSLVDPGTDDAYWSDSEEDYDYDYSSEESKEKVNNVVRSFDDDILPAKSDFVGRCIENCNDI